jgi:hypothetical protein
MTSAPRDGTLIEIECGFGTKPWRRIVKWRSDAFAGWVAFPDFMSGPAFEGSCWWRPFSGDPAAHYDPYEQIDDFAYHCGDRPLLDEPFRPLERVKKALKALAAIGASPAIGSSHRLEAPKSPLKPDSGETV